jgi:hypothetical protein
MLQKRFFRFKKGYLSSIAIKKSGAYSLVELMVMVIVIGLITGGVFKGVDLIKNGKVDYTIKQISEIKTAIDVFKDVNGYLPGDINSTSMQDFTNLSDSSKVINISTGFATNRGNGNGLVSWGTENVSCIASSTKTDFLNESTALWYHLYYGKYINEMGVVSSNKSLYTVDNDFSGENVLPKAKIKGLDIVIYGNDLGASNPLIHQPQLNYTGNNIVISSLKPITQTDCEPKSYPFTPALGTQEAIQIDKTIDDGVKTSGNVLYCSTNVDLTAKSFSCNASDTGFATVVVKLTTRS